MHFALAMLMYPNSSAYQSTAWLDLVSSGYAQKTENKKIFSPVILINTKPQIYTILHFLGPRRYN